MASLVKHSIIGPGAIGALTCASVQHSGIVTAHAHRPGLSLARELEIRGVITKLNWQLTDSTDPQTDYFWVCCKASQVIDAVTPLLQWAPNARAVLLHNGMGPQQALRRQYGDRIIVGSTTCGALKQANGQYQQTSFGTTQLGLAEDDPLLQLMRANQTPAFSEQPLQLQACADIDTVLWRKVAINAAINPLTGAKQVPNGELLKPPHRQELSAVIDEISELLQRLNIVFERPLQDIVTDVARISAHNRSSMAEDIAHGRPTEIDYIAGYLIEQAERVNLPLPHLRHWYRRIAQLQAQQDPDDE